MKNKIGIIFLYYSFVGTYVCIQRMIHGQHMPFYAILCLCLIGLLPFIKKEWWVYLLPALFLLAVGLNVLILCTPLGEEKNGALYFLRGCGNNRPSTALYITFLLLFAMHFKKKEECGDENNLGLFLLFAITLFFLGRTAFSPEIYVYTISMVLFVIALRAWKYLSLVCTPVVLTLFPMARRLIKYTRFDWIFRNEKRMIIQDIAFCQKTGIKNRTNPYSGLAVQLLEEQGCIGLILITLLSVTFAIISIRTYRRFELSDRQRFVCLMIGIHLTIELGMAISEIGHVLPAPLIPIYEYEPTMWMLYLYFIEIAVVLHIRYQSAPTKKHRDNKNGVVLITNPVTNKRGEKDV